ncbi:MAG: hypothetical protein SGJ17_15410 [Hyphomicrobiales bacterium]|nr:hypothetical protein [Hyphomicrobiales bacterium]
MSQSSPPSYLRSKQFAAIETAMMQSEKGRSFLRDYLRRNRSAETEALLEAIGKLQRSLGGAGAKRLESVRHDLRGLQRNMARSRRALAEVSPAYSSAAKTIIPQTAPLVEEAREPAQVIAEAAETIGVASNMLHQAGGQERLCGQIERQLEYILHACAVVNMNRERAKKLEAAFYQVEAEIMAIVDNWDFDAAPPEALPDLKPPISVRQAIMSGLAEELSIAMLTDAQKAALFH